MGIQHGSRADSRCTIAGSTNYWERYKDEDGTTIVDDELYSIFANLPTGEREMRYGEYYALLKRVEFGDIIDGGDPSELRPINKDPHLWELRWQWPDCLLRQYHAEPGELPNLLLAVKAHTKVVLLSQQQTHDKQDVEINEAVSRFVFGRRHSWGIGDTI